MISDTEAFAQGLTKRERVWLMAWETTMCTTTFVSQCDVAISEADKALEAFDKQFAERTVGVAPTKPIVFGPIPHLNPVFDPVVTTTPLTSGGFTAHDRKGGEV